MEEGLGSEIKIGIENALVAVNQEEQQVQQAQQQQITKSKRKAHLSTSSKKNKKKQLNPRSGIPKRHFLDRIKEFLNQEECQQNSFTDEARQELQMHLSRTLTIIMKNALTILDKDRKKITPKIMKQAIDAYCNSTERPLIQFQTTKKS